MYNIYDVHIYVAHGSVLFCGDFDSCGISTYILRLPQCQWETLKDVGKIYRYEDNDYIL